MDVLLLTAQLLFLNDFTIATSFYPFNNLSHVSLGHPLMGAYSRFNVPNKETSKFKPHIKHTYYRTPYTMMIQHPITSDRCFILTMYETAYRATDHLNTHKRTHMTSYRL